MGNQGSYYEKYKKSKSLEDHEHHIGSCKKNSDFEVATKLIINHDQEDFEGSKNFAESLRMMNGLSTDELRPTTSVITTEDDAARDRERRKFDVGYKCESAERRKFVRECEKDIVNAHVLI